MSEETAASAIREDADLNLVLFTLKSYQNPVDQDTLVGEVGRERYDSALVKGLIEVADDIVYATEKGNEYYQAFSDGMEEVFKEAGI
jgi:hypothetical protein